MILQQLNDPSSKLRNGQIMRQIDSFSGIQLNEVIICDDGVYRQSCLIPNSNSNERRILKLPLKLFIPIVVSCGFVLLIPLILCYIRYKHSQNDVTKRLLTMHAHSQNYINALSLNGELSKPPTLSQLEINNDDNMHILSPNQQLIEPLLNNQKSQQNQSESESKKPKIETKLKTATKPSNDDDDGRMVDNPIQHVLRLIMADSVEKLNFTK